MIWTIKMNSKNINLIINLLLIILEIIGFVLVFNELGIKSLEYYTEDSNLLLLISSVIFLIYISKNRELPAWFNSFRYVSVVSTTLTLIIVVTVLSVLDNRFRTVSSVIQWIHAIPPYIMPHNCNSIICLC